MRAVRARASGSAVRSQVQISRRSSSSTSCERKIPRLVTAAREGTDTLRALALAGTRLGVVSAAAAGSVHTDMNALGLDDIWDSVDAPAPDKIAVLRARRGNETHAYYFGDTVYDMQSARAAGYTPIAVDRGYTDTGILRQAGATAVLTTFDELPSLLTHPMTTTQRR